MKKIEPFIESIRALYTAPKEIEVKKFVSGYTHPVAKDNLDIYLFGDRLEDTLNANLFSHTPAYLGITEPYCNGRQLHVDVCYFRNSSTCRSIQPHISRLASSFRIEKLVERNPISFLLGLGYERLEKI